MPPNLQLGAEAAPIQIISSDAMTECYFGRQSDRDAMWPTPTRQTRHELEQPRIGSSRMQEGEPEGARFGSGHRSGLLIFSLIAGPWGEGAGPGLAGTLKRPSLMRREH